MSSAPGFSCVIILCSNGPEGGKIKMIRQTVKDNNLEAALKRFKNKVARDGVPSECRKRESYKKPGVVRREAKEEGIKNARKRNRNNSRHD